jgi:hypothetical protein
MAALDVCQEVGIGSKRDLEERAAFGAKRSFVEFSITFDGQMSAYGASGQSPRCERLLAEYVTTGYFDSHEELFSVASVLSTVAN